MNPPHLHLRPLERADAWALLSWRYSPPYELYSSDPDEGEVERLLSLPLPSLAVTDEKKELIAFRCFGTEAQVPGGAYPEEALDMGGGLRPDLTGRGLGRHVLAAAIQYAARAYQPACYRVTVAAFNHRARKSCDYVGFRYARSFHRPSDGMEFAILLRE